MNWLYQRMQELVAKNSLFYFLVASLLMLSNQTMALALAKMDAILRTQESMQEHKSDEPRRLMHAVLLQEFAKGNVVQIVNPENSGMPVKFRKANYHVSANLIAFSFAPKTPIHVSLSMQLVSDATHRVIMSSDRALVVDEAVVDSGLKLQKADFDNSNYGKALTALTRSAAKQFEQKVLQLNL
jgi:hypothetical protein